MVCILADAAGVKGDALADEDNRLRLLAAFGCVLEHDQPRRAACAAAHSKVAVEALGLEPALVADSAGQAGHAGRGTAGLVRKIFRVEKVGRRIG